MAQKPPFWKEEVSIWGSVWMGEKWIVGMEIEKSETWVLFLLRDYPMKSNEKSRWKEGDMMGTIVWPIEAVARDCMAALRLSFSAATNF